MKLLQNSEYWNETEDPVLLIFLSLRHTIIFAEK